MKNLLTTEQIQKYNEFLDFTETNVRPYSNEWDKKQTLPRDIIKKCANKGYLGGLVSKEYGGLEYDCVTFGLMNEAFACESVSLAGLFNVHNMVAKSIERYGTEEQKQKWLKPMAKGELLGALAITEPVAGSDIKGIETRIENKEDYLEINGTKRWITFGGLADVYLVIGKMDNQPVGCIVEKGQEGFNVKEVKDMLGFRASHLAVLEFNNCKVPKENIIADGANAFMYITPYALEYGRISVAWTSLGILRGCLEICSNHVMNRNTFGKPLIERANISKYITEMAVDHEALKLLCVNGCKLKDSNNFIATDSIMMAKYFGAKTAVKNSTNAVQIMGALGCNDNFSVSRYYRDSKTLEIIEGSNEIHEMLLGKKVARQNSKKKDLRFGSLEH